MLLILLFGAMILLARYDVAHDLDSYYFHGASFGLAIVCLTLLIPLRDLIHERSGRVIVFLTMIASILLVRFILPDLGEPLDRNNVSLAVLSGLIWTELIGFFVYAFLRKRGWAPAMFMTGLICVPIFSLTTNILLYNHASEVIPNLPSLETLNLQVMSSPETYGKYLTFFVVYAILYVTKLPTRLTGHYRWKGDE